MQIMFMNIIEADGIDWISHLSKRNEIYRVGKLGLRAENCFVSNTLEINQR